MDDADACYLARGKLSNRANGPKGFTIKPLVFVLLLALVKPSTYEAYTLRLRAKISRGRLFEKVGFIFKFTRARI